MDEIKEVSKIKEQKVVLQVSNLSYKPSKHIVKESLLCVRRKLTEANIGWVFPELKSLKAVKNKDVTLHRMNFTALGGELVGILGNIDERKELISLLAGRRKQGEFSGDVFLSGPNISESTYYYDQVAYVHSSSVYIPGLTYGEMLHFSVSLRLRPSSDNAATDEVDERVQQLLNIMKLQKCKNRAIPVHPQLRGEFGGDLRRLAIACEVSSLPPVVVIDEPTLNFDSGTSMTIIHALKSLSERGHIVICSMTKPFLTEFEQLDRLVLLSEGYSVYSNAPKNSIDFFCGAEMGYYLKPEVNVVDFLLDISDGTERPTSQRAADLPSIMQVKFESSQYNEAVSPNATSVSAFSDAFFSLYGYGHFDQPKFALKRIITVIKRAIYTKFRDFESLRQQIQSVLVVGVIIGYLQFNQGSYGKYANSLLGLPYSHTANLCSFMFLSTAFSWAYPYLGIHVICQKLKLFRYEQESGCCTTFAFLVATIFAEIPFNTVFILIYANIVYFMVNLDKGYNNYFFWVITLCLLSCVGLIGAYLYCAIFRKEVIVRELFVITITIAALTSGFPFQLPNMYDYLSHSTAANPLRWTFEGLMEWKFQPYYDGDKWLSGFGFETFQHIHTHTILGNFIMIMFSVLILALLKEPLFLHRKLHFIGEESRPDRDMSINSTGSVSMDLPIESELPRRLTRQSELAKPLLFMRESSVTGNASKLSVNVSQVGQENSDNGPTVMFQNVNFRIPDRKSPMGVKTILNRVSGTFGWGKLSLILGGAESGKTTLLHVLAGDKTLGAEITGIVSYNGTEPDPSEPLWRRCGFVPAQNDHITGFTIREVLTYAMKLRCINHLGLSVVDENVNRTMEILQLEGDQVVKRLNAGELKRLSIAEEIVHGAKLLFLDEPTTGVNLLETSILLLTFREMVNQGRTVIATMYQPTAESFKLFDTLLLLSKGRVIYHGPAANAVNFFVTSPYAYDIRSYNNPADFLTDIAGGFLPDSKGDMIDVSVLENYYTNSDLHNRLQARFRNTILSNKSGKSGMDSVDNPMAMYGKKNSGLQSIQESSQISGSDVMGGPDDRDTVTMLSHAANQNPARNIPVPLLILAAVMTEMTTKFTVNDWAEWRFKAGVLVERSFYSFYRHPELPAASIFVHVILAIIFGWIMGDSSGSAGLYNTVSFYAIGSLFLIFANIGVVYYMFNNHKVFLKEYSRGLYTNFSKWLLLDYPLYLLRCIHGIIYCGIVMGMVNQNDDSDSMGFAMLSYMTFVVLTTIMTECIVNVAPDKPAIYVMVSSIGFLNFLFSGLFVKSSTLPSWLRPWTPSVSVIRWMMQANFINTYDGDTTVFPTIPTSGYSVYTAFLTLFGWGGKTKWYCFYMLLALISVYKTVSLWTSGFAAVTRKGGRKDWYKLTPTA